ncbi:recombinase family protein [Brevibacterium luteolum]|uniref:recombinase family protein n=1 Tax=Brevibacterium luteolum TaxID=199591 RepID=UPI001C2309DC|nr:recombinase family protein [Brevibacterium luteolum]MBU8579013.1 recombinase family protein [Brevibacterium luteolum]
MKAVTYRYSAAENPTWLDQQEADCRRYADEHGMTVTEVFTDVGRSRYGLQGVLDAVEREDVTGLIVTDLARLGSKYADHVAVVQQLHDAGVDIHITNDRTTSSVEENLIAVKQAYTEANARFADYPLSSDDPDH